MNLQRTSTRGYEKDLAEHTFSALERPTSNRSAPSDSSRSNSTLWIFRIVRRAGGEENGRETSVQSSGFLPNLTDKSNVATSQSDQPESNYSVRVITQNPSMKIPDVIISTTCKALIQKNIRQFMVQICGRRK